MKLKGTLAALSAVAALALTAPVAQADSLKVTIDSDAAAQGRYVGKVKAKRAKCAKGRTVEAYSASSGFFIGATVTDAKGRFELFEYAPPAGQQVRIVVPAKGLRRGVCAPLEVIATVPEDPAVP